MSTGTNISAPRSNRTRGSFLGLSIFQVLKMERWHLGHRGADVDWVKRGGSVSTLKVKTFGGG